MNGTMKTPEEIAKNLRWLARETEFVFAKEQLTAAADLIEELKARHTQAALNYQHKCRDVVYLESQLTESQRREKAAVSDLHHGDACTICKYFDTAPKDCDAECDKCNRVCVCWTCRDEDKWQWRGPEEEDDETDS